MSLDNTEVLDTPSSIRKNRKAKRLAKQAAREVEAPTTAAKVKKAIKAAKKEKAAAKPKAPDTRESKDHPLLGVGQIPVSRTGKIVGRGLPCLFSGGKTVTENALFISGGDASLRKLILGPEVEGDIKAALKAGVNKTVLQIMTLQPVAGLKIKGNKIVDVKRKASDSDDEGSEDGEE